MLFCDPLIFLFKISFLKNHFGRTFRMSNNLIRPRTGQTFWRAVLGLNCLQMLSIEDRTGEKLAVQIHVTVRPASTCPMQRSVTLVLLVTTKFQEPAGFKIFNPLYTNLPSGLIQ